jgi:hypothetical protein
VSRKHVFALEKHDISYNGSKSVSNNIMRRCTFPSMENKTKGPSPLSLSIDHGCNGVNLKPLGGKDTTCV